MAKKLTSEVDRYQQLPDGKSYYSCYFYAETTSAIHFNGSILNLETYYISFMRNLAREKRDPNFLRKLICHFSSKTFGNGSREDPFVDTATELAECTRTPNTLLSRSSSSSSNSSSSSSNSTEDRTEQSSEDNVVVLFDFFKTIEELKWEHNNKNTNNTNKNPDAVTIVIRDSSNNCAKIFKEYPRDIPYNVAAYIDRIKKARLEQLPRNLLAKFDEDEREEIYQACIGKFSFAFFFLPPFNILFFRECNQNRQRDFQISEHRLQYVYMSINFFFNI